MDEREFPIIEYDPEKIAIIEPSKVIKNIGAPDHCVIPFFRSVIKNLSEKGLLKEIAREHSIASPDLPLYEMDYEGKRLAIMSPALGAPFAAGIFEYAIASGCKKFIVFGSCGVLDSKIDRSQLIIPTSAIRDEGTSYHYLPPKREIEFDPNIVATIQNYFDQKGIKYVTGKTWSTDAFYRETPNKIKSRKAEGAVAVEMEASALAAVAKFRNVSIGYILAPGDDVSGIDWDPRIDTKTRGFHEKLFWLAAKLCYMF